MKPSDLIFITKISARVSSELQHDEVEGFIEKMFKLYSRSASYQSKNGVQFTLKFDEYMALYSDQMLNSMARSYKKDTVEKRQNQYSNYALLLTWKSRQDKLNGVMNEQTAVIAGRAKSKHNCRYLPDEERSVADRKKMSDAKIGTKRPEEVKAKISETKTGVPNSDEHNAAISAATKGVPKSAESNKRRSEAAKAYWAARKAAQSR
ncbi:hypothetical protein AB3G45_19745 [Shinella sp. S4-D37]|uniref:hypothetical protein n=1 Tax=Shinella sp. S4-D37 TaxID=3161999 RepID=UPI00346714E6